jgi:hypothetical protein
MCVIEENDRSLLRNCVKKVPSMIGNPGASADTGVYGGFDSAWLDTPPHMTAPMSNASSHSTGFHGNVSGMSLISLRFLSLFKLAKLQQTLRASTYLG